MAAVMGEVRHRGVSAAPPAPVVAPVAPAPAPPPPREPACDLTQLARHLGAKDRKALLALIRPLAATSLPEPADLGPFWREVEEAIRSLHPSLGDFGMYTSEHVRNLAPTILGARGWHHFAG